MLLTVEREGYNIVRIRKGAYIRTKIRYNVFMMKSFYDNVICLGKVTYSESSQIVTLLSKDHGKIRGIAKGARREKGGFSGRF